MPAREFEVGDAPDEVARAGVALQYRHVVDHRLVEDEPGAAVVLVANQAGEIFGEFVGEAFAPVVHKDGTVDAHLMRQDETGKGKGRRVHRDGLHVDRLGPHSFGKQNAVARGRRGVGGLQPLRMIRKAGDHRFIGAEAAVAMTTAGASMRYSSPFVLRTTTPLTRPASSVVMRLTAVRVRMGMPRYSTPCRSALMTSGPMRPRLG